MNENLISKNLPLIKFQNKERLVDTQSKYLYCKKLSYYQNLEKESGNDSVGDSSEASYYIHDGYFQLAGSDKKYPLKDYSFKTDVSNSYVFCMFGFKKETEHFIFSKEQKLKLHSFGDSALFISDTKEFINRVQTSGRCQRFKVSCDFVKYFDPTYDEVSRLMAPMFDPTSVAFYKRDKYAYQQEFRFLFTPIEKDHNAEDYIKIPIDISDISTLVPIETILNGKLVKGAAEKD